MNPGSDESWLILETSGRTGSVAIARGSSVVREEPLDASRKHARDLAATVARLLENEGQRASDLTGVIVSIGPGSYTGLRVGVMSAKALAYASGCKLVAAPTFAAIAEQAPEEATSVWVLADALQGQVYFQRFDRDPTSGLMASAFPLGIDSLELTIPWTAEGAWFSGPGASLVEAKYPDVKQLVPVVDRHPRPESLLKAAQRCSPVTREELFSLEPLYLRGSSAEEKAERDARRT